jgi:hypothetical protein
LVLYQFQGTFQSHGAASDRFAGRLARKALDRPALKRRLAEPTLAKQTKPDEIGLEEADMG